MVSHSSSLFLVIIFFCASSIPSSLLTRAHEQNEDEEIKSVGRRFLLGFKDTPKGSNITFACSPSGPCVSCNSSEMRKEKYRCSETGYRIRFKCKDVTEEGLQKKDVEKTQNGQSNLNDEETQNVQSNIDDEETQNVQSNIDDEETQNVQSNPEDEEIKPRNLLDDAPETKVKSQSYKTYRSCVPSADEEKLSVLGFEAIMLGLLLISGTAIYIRKKQIVPMVGVSSGRSQSNSRF